MKKIISVLLLLTLVLGLFAGCDMTGTQPTTAPKGNGLDAAAEYLYAMYKNGSELTSSDYTVVGVVRIEDVSYTVTWTTDCEQIVVTPGADKMVTIDLPGDNTEEIAYKLIGTVADAEGNTKSVEFGRKVPAGILTEAQIVELAYSMQPGDVLTGPYKLSGTIVSIDTAWSDQYKNITVTIQVGDMADKPIMCYRLAGEGAATLAVGDQIIVEGALKNYNGTIEFDAGCQLLGVVKTIDQTAILEAAYALAPGAAMETNAVLKGVISSIDTEWSDQYQNITVTIICDGKTEYPIKCYRLKGEGAANLAVGNEIVVTGKIKNYQHSSGDCEVEFDAGCQLVALEDYAALYEQLHGAGATEPEKPEPQLPEVTDPAEGTAYKFGMIQVKNGHTVYLAGGVDQGRFLTTTTDKAAALDVFVEKVEGGIKISTTIEGAKVYVTLTMNAEGKTALGFAAEGTVFQFDATTCVWFTNVDGTDYYIGSYNTFDTMSPSKTSYINVDNSGIEQFPAGFFNA